MTKAAPSNPGKTARIEVFRTGTFTRCRGSRLPIRRPTLRPWPMPMIRRRRRPLWWSAIPPPTRRLMPGRRASNGMHRPDRLFAVIGEIAPAFAEAVEAKHYKKVSLSFHRPDAAANPVPGTWYPKHIGFLGGAAPAVTGLKNVQFSGPETETVVFLGYLWRTRVRGDGQHPALGQGILHRTLRP